MGLFYSTAVFPANHSASVDVQHERRYAPVGNQQGKTEDGRRKKESRVTPDKTDVLQGTLDLMVMKTLESMGSQHGYGIAQRLQQVSEDLLRLNQGTLYPALLRLEQRGWISSKWGTSENTRRARFYTLTRAGRKQLLREADDWHRMAAIMARLLGGTPPHEDMP
jgi:PadR family transcriptional regulator PadR